jgi:hypothetical protein
MNTVTRNMCVNSIVTIPRPIILKLNFKISIWGLTILISTQLVKSEKELHS